MKWRKSWPVGLQQWLQQDKDLQPRSLADQLLTGRSHPQVNHMLRNEKERLFIGIAVGAGIATALLAGRRQNGSLKSISAFIMFKVQDLRAGK
jgi:hypothetical protein